MEVIETRVVRLRWGICCALAASFASVIGPACATVIFGPGGSYTVNQTIHDDVGLEEGARLELGAGARVYGNGFSQDAQNEGAVTVRGSVDTTQPRTKLKLNGDARILAGENQVGIHVARGGDVSLSGNTYVRGGIRSGGWPSHLSDDPNRYPARLFLAGNSFVDGDVRFSNYISISENAVIDGRLSDDNGNLFLEMTGGVIRGNVFLGSANDFLVRMSGGSMLDGMRCHSSSVCNIEIKGGRIANGYVGASTSSSRVVVTGGRIDGGILAEGGFHDEFRFFGGQFDASSGGWILNAKFLPGLTDNSLFEIYGGQWGYTESGHGLMFDGYTDLTMYGMGLEYLNGYLTGLLSDGSYINVALTFGDNWAGTFSIVKYDMSVPEPGTLALLGLGLVGLGFARRKKAH